MAAGAGRAARGRRPALERLEDRRLLAMTAPAITVNTLADKGPPAGTTSFREAITQADALGAATPGVAVTIKFSVTGEIDLASALPVLTGDVTVSGPGASSLAIRGDKAGDRVLSVASGAAGVSLSGLTFVGGTQAAPASGGLFNLKSSSLTVQGCVVEDFATSGIYNGPGATLAVTASTIQGNVEENAPFGSVGGGIDDDLGTVTVTRSTIAGNLSGSTFAPGGGIGEAIASAAGPFSTLTVIQSTISGNSAPYGGGIGISQYAVATIVDSTIANNQATGPDTSFGGGGINFNAGAALTISGSTIAGNGAGAGLGGGLDVASVQSKQPLLRDTIVAGNTDSAGPDDVLGLLDPGGSFNLIGTGTIGNVGSEQGLADFINGNQVGGGQSSVGNHFVIDPRLGPLQANGGPTFTMAPLPGSPALDRGGPDAVLDPLLATDQRGQPRVVALSAAPLTPGGDGRDVGAFEVQATTSPTVLTVNSTSDAATPPAGVLTLRQAIEAADGTLPISALPPGQVAGNSPYNFFIDFSVTGAIGLTSALPAVVGDVAIDGPAAQALTIDAPPSSTLPALATAIRTSSVSLFGLTLINPVGVGLLNAAGSSLAAQDCIFEDSSIGVSDGVGASLALVGCTILDNTAGGLIDDYGTVTVTRSTIAGNTRLQGGGISFGSATDSTGVLGSLTVIQSTISGNTAKFAGVTKFGIGAGIYLGSSTTTTILDSTISGNTAETGGGGIEADGTGLALTISGSTISGNGAPAGQGGGVEVTGGAAPPVLRDTIVAGNTGGDVAGALDPTGSYDLIGDGTGMTGIPANGLGMQVGTAAAPIDPRLGPLQANGGPTFTQALLAGSPALGAGSGEATADTDQRGVPRRAVEDIGAYQATAADLILLYPSPTVAGDAHTFLVAAEDPFGQPAYDFSGPVTFSSSDRTASLPIDSSLYHGFGSFTGTLFQAGLQTISVSGPGIAVTQSEIVVLAAAPASIQILSGAGQSATVTTAFAAPLQSIVTDRYGNAVAGATVTFLGGSAGTFAGGLESVAVFTDAGGVATSPAFIAGPHPGSFADTASVPGVASINIFSLVEVAAGPLTVASAATLKSLQGDATGPLTLATFGDPDLAAFAQGQYTATVAWGDGATDTAAVSIVGGVLVVTDAHLYTSAGGFSPVVTLTHTPTGRTITADASIQVAADVSAQVRATKSGLFYDHHSRLFQQTITLTNAGTTSLTGTLTEVLAGLPAAVSASGTGTTGSGLPSLAIVLAGPLLPGQSITVTVKFADPSFAFFDYIVRSYN